MSPTQTSADHAAAAVHALAHLIDPAGQSKAAAYAATITAALVQLGAPATAEALSAALARQDTPQEPEQATREDVDLREGDRVRITQPALGPDNAGPGKVARTPGRGSFCVLVTLDSGDTFHFPRTAVELIAPCLEKGEAVTFIPGAVDHCGAYIEGRATVQYPRDSDGDVGLYTDAGRTTWAKPSQLRRLAE